MTTGWQCPSCGRRFTRQTREHSCELTSLDKHLDRASPEIRATFEALCALLRAIGPMQFNPLKTMITLSTTKNFGGITIRKSRIDLGFFLPRQERDGRIARTEKISAQKIAHHVQLSSPVDVDQQLEQWLRESYAFAS